MTRRRPPTADAGVSGRPVRSAGEPVHRDGVVAATERVAGPSGAAPGDDEPGLAAVLVVVLQRVAAVELEPADERPVGRQMPGAPGHQSGPGWPAA